MMKFFLVVLSIAAVTAVQPNGESIADAYERIMKMVAEAEQKYNELPSPKQQLEILNASSILRLSEHLKKSYEIIRENALSAKCNEESPCYGSDAYKSGVTRVCLHTDKHVAHEIALYESFTECSDKYLSEIVSHIELVEVKINDLRTSKRNLDDEYKDEENRHELGLILEYHSQLVENARNDLIRSVNSLKALYNILSMSLRSCAKEGYPKINKKMYYVASVQQCMDDFLKMDHTTNPLPTTTENATQGPTTTENIVHNEWKNNGYNNYDDDYNKKDNYASMNNEHEQNNHYDQNGNKQYDELKLEKNQKKQH